MKKIAAIEGIQAGAEVCAHTFKMQKEAALSNAVSDYHVYTTVQLTAAPGRTLPEKVQAWFRNLTAPAAGEAGDEIDWLRQLGNDEFVGDMNIQFDHDGWQLNIWSVYGVTFHNFPDRTYLQDVPQAMSLEKYLSVQDSLPQTVFAMDCQFPLEGIDRFLAGLMA